MPGAAGWIDILRYLNWAECKVQQISGLYRADPHFQVTQCWDGIAVKGLYPEVYKGTLAKKELWVGRSNLEGRKRSYGREYALLSRHEGCHRQEDLHVPEGKV